MVETEKLKAMLADILGIDASEITEDSRFKEDLRADSLDLVQMIIAVENEFGITFEDDDLRKITCIRDFMAFLAK